MKEQQLRWEVLGASGSLQLESPRSWRSEAKQALGFHTWREVLTGCIVLPMSELDSQKVLIRPPQSAQKLSDNPAKYPGGEHLHGHVPNREAVVFGGPENVIRFAQVSLAVSQASALEVPSTPF